MKIAMVASEALPLCKTGGLADVAFSLSKALVKAGDEVVIVLPFYQAIADRHLKLTKLGGFFVQMSWRQQGAAVFSYEHEGVKFLLIQNDYYFSRESLYGYNDDGERFAFFALGALEALKVASFRPDVIHVHDWQSAMIPCLLKNREDPYYDHTKTVLTIHNPAFKGMIDKYFLNDFYGLSDVLFDSGAVRFEGMVSTLKSGIVFADKVTTVSPTHREELLTPAFSQGLDGVLRLREKDFVGILNGIDTEEWNPRTDVYIAQNYGKGKDLEDGKHLNQADLLASFGVNWMGGPVYGLVSRLSFQKGIGLAIHSMRRALAHGANFLVVGSGEYELEQELEELRREYSGTMGIYIGYNNTLAHKIYAGSDFFLMPSLFEPCGISQMIAQRYGTLPIVRYTGGLSDTVHGYRDLGSSKPDGLAFRDYNEQGLDYAVGLAEETYSNQGLYYEMARWAMGLDRSWKKSAARYRDLYRSIA